MDTINTRFQQLVHDNQATWHFADADQYHSPQDIDDRVEDYAQALRRQGLKAQDTVGLVLNNGLDMVSCLLACWRLNLVAIPLRTKAGKYLNYAEFLQGCDRTCHFKLVLCDASISQEDIQQWRAQTGLAIFPQAEFATPHTLPVITPATPRLEDMAIIQFSSGSTGFPKGVIVTHGMIINQLKHIVAAHRATIRHTACWTPMHHDMGLFTGVLLPVFAGNDHTVATPEFYMRNPARWFRMLADSGVDLTFSTNSAMVAALRTVKRLYSGETVNLSRLHLYLSAEKVSPVVLARIHDRFGPLGLGPAQVHSAYGMAENSLGASISGPGELQTLCVQIDPQGKVHLAEAGSDTPTIELVSAGVANAHHRITIRDDQDQPLGELELGEISLESDCLTPGYLNMPHATEAKLQGARLRTGDLGFLHHQQLYFYSRKDDLIIVGGRNIVPDDVEETVEGLAFVRASGSALLCIENDNTGLMELHLVLEGDANVAQAESLHRRETLMKVVLDHHDVVLNQCHFCARGTIEKTSSGKKRRSVIRRRLLDRQIDLIA